MVQRPNKVDPNKYLVYTNMNILEVHFREETLSGLRHEHLFIY